MPTTDDFFLLISTGVIALSLVAIVAILATARGAYAAPVMPTVAFNTPNQMIAEVSAPQSAAFTISTP